eukprot:g6703.t1
MDSNAVADDREVSRDSFDDSVFLCPIGHETMVDPVIMADGHSYERANIEAWLARSAQRPTSPVTNALLPHTALLPNLQLKQAIQTWNATAPRPCVSPENAACVTALSDVEALRRQLRAVKQQLKEVGIETPRKEPASTAAYYIERAEVEDDSGDDEDAGSSSDSNSDGEDGEDEQEEDNSCSDPDSDSGDEQEDEEDDSGSGSHSDGEDEQVEDDVYFTAGEQDSDDGDGDGDGRGGNGSYFRDAIDRLASDAQSTEPHVQHDAVARFRKLLTKAPRKALTYLLWAGGRAGVVPRLVAFLKDEAHSTLQHEAARALKEAAWGTSNGAAYTVIADGAVPALVQLLRSPSARLQYQALRALRSISMGSRIRCQRVLQGGALEPLLQLLQTSSTALKVMRQAMALLATFCRARAVVHATLPALARLIHVHDDHQVLEKACLALARLSNPEGESNAIQDVIEAGVLRRIVQLMNHPHEPVVDAALRTLSNVTANNDLQTQSVLDCGALPCVRTLLLGYLKAGCFGMAYNIISAALDSIRCVMKVGDQELRQGIFTNVTVKNVLVQAIRDAKIIEQLEELLQEHEDTEISGKAKTTLEAYFCYANGSDDEEGEAPARDVEGEEDDDEGDSEEVAANRLRATSDAARRSSVAAATPGSLLRAFDDAVLAVARARVARDRDARAVVDGPAVAAMPPPSPAPTPTPTPPPSPTLTLTLPPSPTPLPIPTSPILTPRAVVAPAPNEDTGRVTLTPQMIMGVQSTELAVQMEATTQFRKLLSIERSAPIQHVIDANVVPRFVEFLQNGAQPALQHEAAWALTNIASGTTEQTKVVVDAGVVPIFTKLLLSPSDDVREQAAWALGNIAGDTTAYRDLVLRTGALEPLLQLLQDTNSKLSMLRHVTRALRNSCGPRPLPPFELVRLPS